MEVLASADERTPLHTAVNPVVWMRVHDRLKVGRGQHPEQTPPFSLLWAQSAKNKSHHGIWVSIESGQQVTAGPVARNSPDRTVKNNVTLRISHYQTNSPEQQPPEAVAAFVFVVEEHQRGPQPGCGIKVWWGGMGIVAAR